MNDRNAPASFSWGMLITDMKLTGLPALIACHTEPVSYDASIPRLELQVISHMRELLDSPAMDRLKLALNDHFGANLELEVSAGAAKRSPAAIAYQRRVGRFAQAYSHIADDDFVARMIDEFGGMVIVDSVKTARRSP